jgi:hypothetical protein
MRDLDGLRVLRRKDEGALVLARALTSNADDRAFSGLTRVFSCQWSRLSRSETTLGFLPRLSIDLSAIRKVLCISIATRVAYHCTWGKGVKMVKQRHRSILAKKSAAYFLQSRYTLREDREYTETRRTSHWYDVCQE